MSNEQHEWYWKGYNDARKGLSNHIPDAKNMVAQLSGSVEQDSVAMADYMALVEKYAFLKAAHLTVSETYKRKPLTEQFIMDSTRNLSLDVRWPSTFIDVWRLCEAAHGIKE